MSRKNITYIYIYIQNTLRIETLNGKKLWQFCIVFGKFAKVEKSGKQPFTIVRSEENPKNKPFRQHEQAKKREYMQRVLEIEHGTFTPLIMGTNGGMGGECEQFISRFANKLAIKQNESYSTVLKHG